MSDITELSQAFAPCTIPGLADEWHRMNQEIAALRKQRDALDTILLEWSAARSEGEEPFRVGAWIEGETVKIRAVWRLMSVSSAGKPIWQPHLDYDRERR